MSGKDRLKGVTGAKEPIGSGSQETLESLVLLQDESRHILKSAHKFVAGGAKVEDGGEEMSIHSSTKP